MRGDKAVGAITLQRLEGQSGTVEAAAATSNPSVHRFTPLSRLFAQSATQEEPLVILDRAGAPVGLLSRDRLLEALAGGDNNFKEGRK